MDNTAPRNPGEGGRTHRNAPAERLPGPEERPEELEWGRHRYFPAGIEVGLKGEAFRVARDWQDKENSIWTDGPRSEDEKVGGGGGVVAGGEGGAAVDRPRPASGRRYLRPLGQKR